MKPKPPIEADDVTENIDFLGIDPTRPVSRENAEVFVSPHEWDESPETHGHQVPRQKLEDEVSANIELVYQGVNEADRELRVAAEPERNEDEEDET